MSGISISGNVVKDANGNPALTVGTAGSTWAKAVLPAVVALTDGATIATDASLGNLFTVTLGGNRTMAAPTNPTDGQVIRYRVTQDATGSRLITWNAAFRFGTTYPAPTLSTAAAKVDYVEFQYSAADSKWDCTGFAKAS